MLKAKPWEVYSDYLPEKTSDQLLMFLMEEGLGLYHGTSYQVGVIPDYEGYCLNVEAPTLVDALRGAMVKLYFSREDNSIGHGSACFSDEKLKEHQRTFYNANAFLKYGGYAEQKGYRPTDRTPSVITVKGFRKNNNVVLKTNIVRI